MNHGSFFSHWIWRRRWQRCGDSLGRSRPLPRGKMRWGGRLIGREGRGMLGWAFRNRHDLTGTIVIYHSMCQSGHIANHRRSHITSGRRRSHVTSGRRRRRWWWRVLIRRRGPIGWGGYWRAWPKGRSRWWWYWEDCQRCVGSLSGWCTWWSARSASGGGRGRRAMEGVRVKEELKRERNIRPNVHTLLTNVSWTF